MSKSNETGLNQLALDITTWRKAQGFYTPRSLSNTTQGEALLGKLMLVVTEVSEAAEEVRHMNREKFEVEIADAFIRLLDICGSMDIDIHKRIIEKMAVNQNRPTRHGTKLKL